MIKIRLSSEDADELEKVVQLFEGLFPEMRFSAVRLGGNPKYANDPKYFSYGEPRIRNKQPVKVDIDSARRRLGPAALPKKTSRK